MPWHLERRDGKVCVIKDSDGSSAGCHASRAKAMKQMAALYANESRMASMATDVPVGDPNLGWYYLGPVTANPWQQSNVSDVTLNLTAAAPLNPPREFFHTPEPDRPTPMTYEDDGRVFGHVAVWGSCHRGFLGGAFESCVQPPRSATEYAQFHQGYMQTAEGERVAIGKITFDTDHAPLTADVVAASRHYDNTGAVGAYVRATNGQHGIWVSGVLRPDLGPSGLVTLRANAPSGDWRMMNGNLEMVAALAVPVNGFEAPQLALSASVEGGVSALILPGFCAECEEEVTASARPKSYLRKRATLSRDWQL